MWKWKTFCNSPRWYSFSFRVMVIQFKWKINWLYWQFLQRVSNDWCCLILYVVVYIYPGAVAAHWLYIIVPVWRCMTVPVWWSHLPKLFNINFMVYLRRYQLYQLKFIISNDSLMIPKWWWCSLASSFTWSKSICDVQVDVNVQLQPIC